MNKIVNRCINEKNMCRIFNLMAVLMFSLLFFYGLELTGVNTILTDERISFVEETVFFQILKLSFAFVALYFVGRAAEYLQSKVNRNVFLAVCCVISAIISFYWIINCPTAPQADQKYVVKYADLFNSGDFSSLEKGGYVAIYQQQLGLITFMRAFFAIFGAKNHFAFQVFIAAFVPVIIFAGCMIVRYISDNDMKAELYYLIFSITCFPMYAYTPFVYGDLVSVPFALISIWMLLSCLRDFKIKKLIIMGASIGFSIILRQNVVIIAIAMLLVVGIKILKKPEKKTAFIAVAIVLGILVPQLFIKVLYAGKIEPDTKGMPATCHIAMGLSGGGATSGWYSRENLNIFEESNFDATVANKVATERIVARVDKFKSNPGAAAEFFLNKMNSQWNVPMYQCLNMNNRITGEQSALVADIYNGGTVGKLVQEYSKIFQLVLYGSVLCMLVVKFKGWNNVEKYILLIAVFGGFLFSLFWEAKPRYIFPYLLLMLPYIGIGIDSVIKSFSKIISE